MPIFNESVIMLPLEGIFFTNQEEILGPIIRGALAIGTVVLVLAFLGFINGTGDPDDDDEPKKAEKREKYRKISPPGIHAEAVSDDAMLRCVHNLATEFLNSTPDYHPIVHLPEFTPNVPITDAPNRRSFLWYTFDRPLDR